MMNGKSGVGGLGRSSPNKPNSVGSSGQANNEWLYIPIRQSGSSREEFALLLAVVRLIVLIWIMRLISSQRRDAG